jgi:hypothetical protein
VLAQDPQPIIVKTQKKIAVAGLWTVNIQSRYAVFRITGHVNNVFGDWYSMMRNMPRTVLLLLSFAGFLSAQQSVRFQEHTIEANIPGGYALIVADVNHDGKPDVIGVSQQVKDLSWYENPTWQPHVIVRDTKAMVNLAATDLDGDGIPEIAVESGFAMDQARSSGLVWLLSHQGDPRELWKATKIDSVTTSHHVAWADVDGDGKKELINAPLIGVTNAAPTYLGKTPLFFYRVPASWSNEWKREVVDSDLNGITHRVRVVKWDPNTKREQLLTAGFDGVILHSASGTGDRLTWDHKLIVSGHTSESAPRVGTSDVRVAHLRTQRFLATVEPWHGNEVVVYTSNGKNGWVRHVLYDGISQGHEVCVGDFNGDGRDEIVAGDRSKDKAISHLFYSLDATGRQWRREELDPMAMSASGCEVADINGDGRPDIVMIGGASHNIKWYENLGPSARLQGTVGK